MHFLNEWFDMSSKETSESKDKSMHLGKHSKQREHCIKTQITHKASTSQLAYCFKLEMCTLKATYQWVLILQEWLQVLSMPYFQAIKMIKWSNAICQAIKKIRVSITGVQAQPILTMRSIKRFKVSELNFMP